MKTTLLCIETGRKTGINLTVDEPWLNDDILDVAANRLLRREPEHKYDFVCISADRMRSEIFHDVGGLTEHTGEYLTYKIIPYSHQKQR